MSTPSRTSLLVAAFAVGLVYLGILVALRFHLCLNDFWALSFLARSAEVAQPATYWNGFMPPGYVLFLAALGPARELAGAFVLTLAAVVVTALAAGVLTREEGLRAPAWLVATALAIFPPFLASGLTAGPDIVVTALVAVAAVLHVAAPDSRRRAWAAGLLCAVALLVRSHAAFAGFGLLLAVAIVERRNRPATIAMAAGLAAGVLAQAGFNLAAGQPAWANAQAFNVYKMVHGMDWYAPVDPSSLSVVSILTDSPFLFLKEWAGAFLRAGVWLAGPALAILHARHTGDHRLQRIAAIALVAGLVYTIPVSLGDSPRTAVVLSALVIPPVAALLAALRRSGPHPGTLLTAAVLAWGLAGALQADRAFLRHNFVQSRTFAQIEEELRAAGARRADAVFTDDFDLYFRDLEGQRPLTRGGWGIVGIEGWAERYPQLPIHDSSLFLESCREHGVRFLALTPRVRRMGPVLDEIRNGPARPGLRRLGASGEFVLLALE